MAELSGRRIALLLANGFEEDEMLAAREVLAAGGAELAVVAAKKHLVRGWRNTVWGEEVPVDEAIVDAAAGDYAGLVIPGGVLAADTLRSDVHAVRLVRDALDRGMPVGAIGHAPWVLVEAQALAGRRVTSHTAIRADLENAGALWRDDPAVADGGIVTGRHRHDLPDFLLLYKAALA